MKREMRRGLPVLRSRETPGRTRTEKNADRAAEQSNPSPPIPVQLIDPAVMSALVSGTPAPHIELSATGGLHEGNAALSFKGRVRADGSIATDHIDIAYPMAGAMGRELTLECTGYFEGDTVVSTATDIGISLFDTVFDQVVIKPHGGQGYRSSIKVLLDTEVMSFNYPFRIVVTGALRIKGCTLDLAAP